jgi:hypothetical protein
VVKNVLRKTLGTDFNSAGAIRDGVRINNIHIFANEGDKYKYLGDAKGSQTFVITEDGILRAPIKSPKEMGS